MLYRDQGVVLRTFRLGEADRIVVLVTEGHGKVRAVVKGVRKTKSRFGSRLEPVSHVALLMYQGRGELEVVNQAETLDHFRAVREDLDRLSKATSMLEVVDQVAQEREPVPALYRMLVGALRQLAARDSPLIVPAFFWKLLALEGLSPVLDRCATCGATEDLVAFDVDEGGVLCRSDRQGVPISMDAIEIIRRILGGGLAGVLDEPSGPAVHEVDHLTGRTVEHHLERRLRSLNLLDKA
jgi:DNA repair protein RecO (recombination protein O)